MRALNQQVGEMMEEFRNATPEEQVKIMSDSISVDRFINLTVPNITIDDLIGKPKQ